MWSFTPVKQLWTGWNQHLSQVSLICSLLSQTWKETSLRLKNISHNSILLSEPHNFIVCLDKGVYVLPTTLYITVILSLHCSGCLLYWQPNRFSLRVWSPLFLITGITYLLDAHWAFLPLNIWLNINVIKGKLTFSSWHKKLLLGSLNSYVYLEDNRSVQTLSLPFKSF